MPAEKTEVSRTNSRLTNKGLACDHCGHARRKEAPEGLCSFCLLQNGLSLLTEVSDNIEIPSGPPAVLADYELIEELGRGGQGVVYRARQISLNRLVALKVIGMGTWATESQLRRFRREARVAASLNHPAIVAVHEIGERESYCYFSMSLIEGAPLDEFVSKKELTPRRAVEMIVPLARAVHFAHERGILHRDIKPGNILIDAEGQPHLTDFGMARLTEGDANITRSREMLGTPSYMAPEQTCDAVAELTRATDVYGLGAVLYRLLTGHPPFSAPSPYEVVRLLLETEPRSPRAVNPSVDNDLTTICLKCLEKDPTYRYSSALELAYDLERWLRREPIRARRTSALSRSGKWMKRNRAVTFSGASSIGLLMALGFILLHSTLLHPASAAGIAVLPFEDLSEKGNNLFADGVQDDLINKLGKVTELRVISRTSVMSYSGKHDARKIGRALNVSHLLEGSVRRTQDRLQIDAELVDTHNDSAVWTEEYDLSLSDLFAVQSAIATNVATKLHLRLTPAEQSAIERSPTTDLTAFDLYTQGRDLYLHSPFDELTYSDLLRAADLLNQAVARDPSFLQAYCQLASIHDLLYLLGHDHTPRRLALAEAAVAAAALIQPDAAEVHLARAEDLYDGHLDYPAALRQLDLASRTLPNDSRIFEERGYIFRREGDYKKSISNFQQALTLDPRNFILLRQLSFSYRALHQWPQMDEVCRRAIAINPTDIGAILGRTEVDMEWKGDLRPLHEALASLRQKHPEKLGELANTWFVCALLERDTPGMRAALAARAQDTVLDNNVIHFPRPFAEGLIAQMTKDRTAAVAAFSRAREQQEKVVAADRSYAPAILTLGIIDAYLGRKDEAMGEGEEALRLMPIQKDAYTGALLQEYFSIIPAWVGEPDRACRELEESARTPSGVTYGELKLVPFWDPLRGRPRFENIVASLAPK